MRKLRGRLSLLSFPPRLRVARSRRKRRRLPKAVFAPCWETQQEPGTRIILPNSLSALDRQVARFQLIRSVGIYDTELTRCRWASPFKEDATVMVRVAVGRLLKAVALKPQEFNSFSRQLRLRDSKVSPAPGLSWYYVDCRSRAAPTGFANWCSRNWNRTFGVTPIRFKTFVRTPTMALNQLLDEYHRSKLPTAPGLKPRVRAPETKSQGLPEAPHWWERAQSPDLFEVDDDPYTYVPSGPPPVRRILTPPAPDSDYLTSDDDY